MALEKGLPAMELPDFYENFSSIKFPCICVYVGFESLIGPSQRF